MLRKEHWHRRRHRVPFFSTRLRLIERVLKLSRIGVRGANAASNGDNQDTVCLDEYRLRFRKNKGRPAGIVAVFPLPTFVAFCPQPPSPACLSLLIMGLPALLSSPSLRFHLRHDGSLRCVASVSFAAVNLGAAAEMLQGCSIQYSATKAVRCANDR